MKLAITGIIICTFTFIFASPLGQVIMLIGVWASSYELYKECNPSGIDRVGG